MYKPVKYIVLFLFALNCFSGYNSIAQTNTKYSESMLEVNEYLLANEFNEALPILKGLIDAGYQNGNVDFKLGMCYLNSYKDRQKAISYFKDAAKSLSENYSDENGTEKNAPLRTLLFLGDAYRLENLFKEAEDAYRKYLTMVISIPIERELATKRLDECHVARILIKNPIQASFSNPGNSRNSGLSDFNACLSGDGKVMVFTRRLKFYDAVFYCTKTGSGWSEPENITTEIGSDGEFHPTGLSIDGSRMLLMSFTALNGYDLYESVRLSSKWSKVHGLAQLNSPYHDIDAVYAPDGKSVLFSSNRKNGIGGYDIYSSTMGKDGSFLLPQNIGSPVNTGWDEKSPSLLNSGNTLLFSSERKPGMGGLDIFYSNKNSDNSWGLVFNIGYPVNSTDNDKGLQFSFSGKDGIISRHDKQGFAEIDILEVKVTDFSKFRLVPLHGEIIVNEKREYTSKGTSFFLIDQTLRDTVTEITESDSGRFNVDLYPGKFELVMSNPTQKSSSQPFIIPSDLQNNDFSFVSKFTDSTDIKFIAKANLIQRIDTIEVFDVYFDFNKTDISANQKKKLVELLKEIQKHRLTKIELYGYSDSRGKPDYNIRLSLKRADELLNFFKQNGISDQLIFSKGLGSSTFVSKNSHRDGSDNPVGRAFNRRVEIVITPAETNIVLHKNNMVPVELRP